MGSQTFRVVPQKVSPHTISTNLGVGAPNESP
jgi:hypothetical protein